MTRIFLPVLLAIVALLGFSVVIPIVIREVLYPYRRTRELDEWASDVTEWDR